MFNKTAVASDAQVPRTTVIEYFEILKDTLIGHELPAWNRSKKRKAIETAKFYLFDVGVARTLRKLPPLVQRSTDLGDAVEHFLFHELRTYIDTRRPGLDLHIHELESSLELDRDQMAAPKQPPSGAPSGPRYAQTLALTGSLHSDYPDVAGDKYKHHANRSSGASNASHPGRCLEHHCCHSAVLGSPASCFPVRCNHCRPAGTSDNPSTRSWHHPKGFVQSPVRVVDCPGALAWLTEA
jgi:hypothetical protein